MELFAICALALVISVSVFCKGFVHHRICQSVRILVCLQSENMWGDTERCLIWKQLGGRGELGLAG